MDVGFELRQARERRGLSLQQITTTTRISPRVLQAIEASDETRLPATVFTRSFVKSYAALLGLDPDDTVRRYLDQFQPAVPPVAEPSRDGNPEGSAVESASHVVGRLLSGRVGSAAVLILVVLTAATLVVRNYTRAGAHRTPSSGAAIVSAAGLTPAAGAAPAPVGTSGQTAGPVDALHVAIAPTGPCWVQATVGGHVVLGKLLNAGDRKTVDAPADLTLRVGDPGTFAFTINGKAAKIPGPAGHAVTVQVTKENYAKFLTQ